MSRQRVPCQNGRGAILMCLFLLVIATKVHSLQTCTIKKLESLDDPNDWPSGTPEFRVVSSSEDKHTHFGFYSDDKVFYKLAVIFKLPKTSTNTKTCNAEFVYQRVWVAKKMKKVKDTAKLVPNKNILTIFYGRDVVWSIRVQSNLSKAEYVFEPGQVKIYDDTNSITLWESCFYYTPYEGQNYPKWIAIFFIVGLSLGVGIGLLALPTYRWLKNIVSSILISRFFLSSPLLPPTLQMLPMRHPLHPLRAPCSIHCSSVSFVPPPFSLPTLPLRHSSFQLPTPSFIPSCSFFPNPSSLSFTTSNSLLSLSLGFIPSPLKSPFSLPILYQNCFRSPLRALCSLPTKLSLPSTSFLFQAPSPLLATSLQKEVTVIHSFLSLSHKFSSRELEIATKNFSKVIGKGGFGKVYEGILPDGTKIAVKRLIGTSQGKKEFQAEIIALGNILHQSIIKLCGYCHEESDQMLVYELAARGSLDHWLFGDLMLDWTTRLQIALDIARGLSFLHQSCEYKIIHFDVKPQNILLDEDFQAKISDFGMSEICNKDTSQIITHMRGTPGYLAPEWNRHPTVSEKCDVYSFGLVLLEIVSGRKNVKFNEDDQKWYFPAWVVRKLSQNENCHECIDIRLYDRLIIDDLNQTIRIIKIALWCIQDTPKLRPSMDEVVHMIEGIADVDDPPLSFEFLETTKR